MSFMHSDVKVFTDSKYVIDGITKGWAEKWKKNGWKTAAKQPVKNQDLWMRLDKAISTHSINWHWVKGHSGHPGNEKADDSAAAGQQCGAWRAGGIPAQY